MTNIGTLLVLVSASAYVDINMLWHRANKNKAAGVKIGASTYVMLLTDCAFITLLLLVGLLLPVIKVPLWLAFILAYFGSIAIRFINTAINAMFLYRVRRKAEQAAKKATNAKQKELINKHGQSV